MRWILVLLRNLVLALVTGTANALKALGLRAPQPDFVVFDLSGDVPWRPPPLGRRLAQRLGGAPERPDLHTTTRRLEALARRPEVRGVVLRLTEPGLSRPKVEALAEAVAAAREAGKEVVVWTPAAGSREAPLLFAADRLLLAPAGRLDLRGFAAETLTARAALERVGARAHVFRRGSHKSAGEVWVRDGVSPEQRETLEALLDGLWDRLVGTVAEGRHLPREAAVRAVDEGPYHAERAREAGLVDGACTAADLETRLAPDGEERVRLAPWRGYRRSRPQPFDWRPLRGREAVLAVVPVQGLLVDEARGAVPSLVPAVAARPVTEALEAARRDRGVRGVVLHIDSRGGSALASDLIWQSVRRVAAEKPVVACLERVAASGGYYVAAGADRIVASPSTVTGSIGVLAALFDLEEAYRRMGVTREVVSRGRTAALGTSVRPPTDAEVAAVERELDAVYDTFLARVADGRQLSEADVRARAEGRVYDGVRARELGLVDVLGGFEAAVGEAWTLAGEPPSQPPRLRVLRPGPTGLVAALRRDGPSGGLEAWAGAGAAAGIDPFLLAWLLAAARDPRAVWAVAPLVPPM